MCRSLFCKPLEHTESFPSSENLLPNSVFGPTLVLSISPQFPEILAGRLLWLEPMRASFVRRVFTAKAIKAAIRDTGLKPRTAVTGIALASQAERFPPPLQFCLPHLAPFQGAQQQCHCPWVTIATARLRGRMAEDKAVADSNAWANVWALSWHRNKLQSKKKNSPKQPKRGIPKFIFKPLLHFPSLKLEHLHQKEKLERDEFRKERGVG